MLRGRGFIDYACFPYGQYNAMISGEPDAHFISDFQYFVFTKSIKTLESIRTLLAMEHMEDVLILLRTTFEGYLASRFIDEEYDSALLNDFIFVPQLIAHRKVIYEKEAARDRYSKELIDFIQRNPSQLKLGKDKAYFSDFLHPYSDEVPIQYECLPWKTDWKYLQYHLFFCFQLKHKHHLKICRYRHRSLYKEFR